MNVDAIPIWVFFVGTILVIVASVEAGYRLGSHWSSGDEKEALISGVSGSILGLTAFILAFAFGIVSERYFARKALVRDDANAIRTTYMRADFLPEPHRTEAKSLLRKYLDLRVAFAQANIVEPQKVHAVRVETDRIQRRLWDIAVVNAERDMNSDVAALYIESLNNVFEVDASRVAVGLQARLPIGIWFVLYGLIIFGMLSIGSHAGFAGSKRSRSTLILAISFAMVITMIASLNRPGGYVRVSQQPLVDLQSFIAAGDAVRRHE